MMVKVSKSHKPQLEGPRFVLEKGKPDYPKALLDLSKPPEFIYGIGNKDILEGGISIIGARRATPYGINSARMFAKEAALHDVVVVSGGALGCDSAAHAGSLEGEGKTVVVLGGGCNVVYPASNKPLFQKIINQGGAVISENTWDSPPKPYCFRERNRIIAALSKATLIVEAGLPSGTFSTADEALAISRDVLVVPGSIVSSHSLGSNQLLYQGATPIINRQTFEDVLVLLYNCLRFEKKAQRSFIAEEDALLEALLASPMRLDELLALNFVVPDGFEKQVWLLMRLSEYEQRGLVIRYPDGRYGPSKNSFD